MDDKRLNLDGLSKLSEEKVIKTGYDIKAEKMEVCNRNIYKGISELLEV